MPKVEMQDMATGKHVRTIVDNAANQKEWDNLGLNTKEFVKVKSGNLMLDA